MRAGRSLYGTLAPHAGSSVRDVRVRLPEPPGSFGVTSSPDTDVGLVLIFGPSLAIPTGFTSARAVIAH